MDLSAYQTITDAAALFAQSPNYIYLRAYGSSHAAPDTTFLDRVALANSYGVPTGSLLFCNAYNADHNQRSGMRSTSGAIRCRFRASLWRWELWRSYTSSRLRKLGQYNATKADVLWHDWRSDYGLDQTFSRIFFHQDRQAAGLLQQPLFFGR